MMKVKITQIQNLVCGTFLCIIIVGINGINALAAPCANKYAKGLSPEMARIHDNRNEYPVISRIKPPKFM